MAHPLPLPASAMKPPAPCAPPRFAPEDPAYAERVRASFNRQGAMRLFDARIVELAPGYCAIELPYRDDLTQQHGYVHAGVVGAIADSAGGYAAFTLFPADASVLTVEYKLNLVAPASGEWLRAQAEVVRPGRTLVI